jgi:hypothetical protein
MHRLRTPSQSSIRGCAQSTFSPEVSCVATTLRESSRVPLKRLIGAGGDGRVRRRPLGPFEFARFSLAAAHERIFRQWVSPEPRQDRSRSCVREAYVVLLSRQAPSICENSNRWLGEAIPFSVAANARSADVGQGDQCCSTTTRLQRRGSALGSPASTRTDHLGPRSSRRWCGRGHSRRTATGGPRRRSSRSIGSVHPVY